MSEPVLLPAAAGAAAHDVLTGAVVPAVVLGATPVAAYLGVPRGVVALLRPRAVRLPIGVVLAGVQDVGALVRGGPVLVGGGGAALPAGSLHVTRWWESRVRAFAPARPRNAGMAAALLDPALGRSGEPLLARPHSYRLGELDPAALVGAGGGLTPAGDDVLAGALVALAAVDDPRAGALAAQIEPLLGRTTALSAALLRCAAAGHAVPEVAVLLRALSDPDPAAVAPAVEQLCRVGHSSGAALALGVLTACGSSASGGLAA